MWRWWLEKWLSHCILLYFWSNKCSLGELRDVFQRHYYYQNITNPKLQICILIGKQSNMLNWNTHGKLIRGSIKPFGSISPQILNLCHFLERLYIFYWEARSYEWLVVLHLFYASMLNINFFIRKASKCIVFYLFLQMQIFIYNY